MKPKSRKLHAIERAVARTILRFEYNANDEKEIVALAKEKNKPAIAHNARIRQEIWALAPNELAPVSLLARLREMARKKHDEADRLYHLGDVNGGYGQRCRALGIEDAIKAIEAQR